MSSQPTPTSFRILLVDDAAEDRMMYKRLLKENRGRHYTISEAETVEEGLHLFRSIQPDCVLLDYRLADDDGLYFLEVLQQEGVEPPYPVVMMTGSGDERVAVEVIRAGAANYVVKTRFTPTGLGHIIEQAIERVQAQHELASLRRAVLEQNEQEIEETEERWRKLVDVLPQAVLLIQDSLIRQANTAAARLLGYAEANDLVGVTWEFRLPSADRALVRAAWKGAGAVRLEHQVLGKGGEPQAVTHRATAVTYHNRPAWQVVLEAALREHVAAAARAADLVEAEHLADTPPAITA